MEFDLKFNLGTLEVGSWVSTFLFGIAASQAYSYYSHHFYQDRWELKAVVIFVMLCELGQTCSTASGFFYISIIQYNEPTKIFAKSPIGYTISTFLSGVIATTVQVYFGLQVLRVTRKRYLAYISWFLSFLRFMGTIGMTFVLATQSLSDFEKTWIAAATWATGAVVDIMIAVSLTMSFIKYRREAIKLKRTLDHLIPMTMQTGLLTSVSTVAIAICFIAMPTTMVWGAVGSALAKIFTISLLASLNARSFLRELETSNLTLRQSHLGIPIFGPNALYSPTGSSYDPQDSGFTVYHSFGEGSDCRQASYEAYSNLPDEEKHKEVPIFVPLISKTNRF